MKRALITGINGMDGSHLADFLLEKGYEVYGMERRTSYPNRLNTKHLEGKITFINGDLSDQNSISRCIKECDPDEIYHRRLRPRARCPYAHDEMDLMPQSGDSDLVSESTYIHLALKCFELKSGFCIELNFRPSDIAGEFVK